MHDKLYDNYTYSIIMKYNVHQVYLYNCIECEALLSEAPVSLLSIIHTEARVVRKNFLKKSRMFQKSNAWNNSWHTREMETSAHAGFGIPEYWQL